MLGIPHMLLGSALSGLLGWIAMVVNVAIATGRARSRQEPPASPLTISLLDGAG